MSAQQNRPDAMSGAVADLAGELITNDYTSYPQTIVLSTAAETYLAKLADDLALGTVATHQLSPALSQFFWLAFWAGHASHGAECQGHLDRMAWERDLWYFCANNKGKRPADFYATATASLWTEAVQ